MDHKSSAIHDLLKRLMPSMVEYSYDHLYTTIDNPRIDIFYNDTGITVHYFTGGKYCITNREVNYVGCEMNRIEYADIDFFYKLGKFIMDAKKDYNFEWDQSVMDWMLS